jgi:hypothetical protein
MNGETLKTVKANLDKAQAALSEAEDTVRKLRLAGRPDPALESRVAEKRREIMQYKAAFGIV